MTIKINDKEYQVKTEWAQFTFREYAIIIGASELPVIDRLSIYSGVPKDLIHKMKVEQLSFLSDLLCFMDEPDNALIFCKPYTDDLNIGRRTYKDLEQALIYIRKAKTPVAVLDKVIKIYYDEDIANMNIIDCLGKGAFIIEQINKFLTEFKRLGEYEMSIEEIEAGVEELSKFGFFATAVQLARKYGKTHDDILNMPAREVYNTLLYDFEQSEVEKRLSKIRSRKR